jgi:hypothetical protein
MTNTTVRLPVLSSTLALLALAHGGCDQPQPAPTAAPAQSAAPSAPAQPTYSPNWIDLPPNRFAPKPDAGTTPDAATTPDAGGPEAETPDPGPPPCMTYYLDIDGDGYGGMPVSICDGSALPSGYVATGGDCCDIDANVHPGQLAYFGTVSACGSFDYDCDGAIEPEDAACQLGCGVPCLHSFTMAVPPEGCR